MWLNFPMLATNSNWSLKILLLTIALKVKYLQTNLITNVQGFYAKIIKHYWEKSNKAWINEGV
jgi:hypothetical protein